MPGTKQDTICHPSAQSRHPFCLPTLQMQGHRYRYKYSYSYSYRRAHRVNVQGFCGIYFVLHFTFAALAR